MFMNQGTRDESASEILLNLALISQQMPDLMAPLDKDSIDSSKSSQLKGDPLASNCSSVHEKKMTASEVSIPNGDRDTSEKKLKPCEADEPELISQEIQSESEAKSFDQNFKEKTATCTEVPEAHSNAEIHKGRKVDKVCNEGSPISFSGDSVGLPSSPKRCRKNQLEQLSSSPYDDSSCKIQSDIDHIGESLKSIQSKKVSDTAVKNADSESRPSAVVLEMPEKHIGNPDSESSQQERNSPNKSSDSTAEFSNPVTSVESLAKSSADSVSVPAHQTQPSENRTKDQDSEAGKSSRTLMKAKWQAEVHLRNVGPQGDNFALVEDSDDDDVIFVSETKPTPGFKVHQTRSMFNKQIKSKRPSSGVKETKSNTLQEVIIIDDRAPDSNDKLGNSHLKTVKTETKEEKGSVPATTKSVANGNPEVKPTNDGSVTKLKSKRKSVPIKCDHSSKKSRIFLTQKQIRKLPLHILKPVLLTSDSDDESSDKQDESVRLGPCKISSMKNPLNAIDCNTTEAKTVEDTVVDASAASFLSPVRRSNSPSNDTISKDELQSDPEEKLQRDELSRGSSPNIDEESSRNMDENSKTEEVSMQIQNAEPTKALEMVGDEAVSDSCMNNGATAGVSYECCNTPEKEPLEESRTSESVNDDDASSGVSSREENSQPDAAQGNSPDGSTVSDEEPLIKIRGSEGRVKDADNSPMRATCGEKNTRLATAVDNCHEACTTSDDEPLCRIRSKESEMKNSKPPRTDEKNSSSNSLYHEYQSTTDDKASHVMSSSVSKDSLTSSSIRSPRKVAAPSTSPSKPILLQDTNKNHAFDSSASVSKSQCHGLVVQKKIRTDGTVARRKALIASRSNSILFSRRSDTSLKDSVKYIPGLRKLRRKRVSTFETTDPNHMVASPSVVLKKLDADNLLKDFTVPLPTSQSPRRCTIPSKKPTLTVRRKLAHISLQRKQKYDSSDDIPDSESDVVWKENCLNTSRKDLLRKVGKSPARNEHGQREKITSGFRAFLHKNFESSSSVDREGLHSDYSENEVAFRYVPKLEDILQPFDSRVTTCCFCHLPANHLLGLGDLFGPYRPQAEEVLARQDSVNEHLKGSGNKTDDLAHSASGSPQVTFDEDEGTCYLTARVEEDRVTVDGSSVKDITQAISGSSHHLRSLSTIDHILQDSANLSWQNKQKIIDGASDNPMLRIPGPKNECKLISSEKRQNLTSSLKDGVLRPQNDILLPNINSIVFLEPKIELPHSSETNGIISPPHSPMTPRQRSSRSPDLGTRRKSVKSCHSGSRLSQPLSPTPETRTEVDGDSTSVCISHKFNTGPLWTHGYCALWADGVYAIRSQLHGLWDAARTSSQITCFLCNHPGATIVAFEDKMEFKTRGVPIKAYHYPCALCVRLKLDWETLTAKKS